MSATFSLTQTVDLSCLRGSIELFHHAPSLVLTDSVLPCLMQLQLSSNSTRVVETTQHSLNAPICSASLSPTSGALVIADASGISRLGLSFLDHSPNPQPIAPLDSPIASPDRFAELQSELRLQGAQVTSQVCKIAIDDPAVSR